MMKIAITSISYDTNEEGIQGVRVFFNANNPEKTLNINGYIPLTAQEYEGKEAITLLSEVVRSKVAVMVSGGAEA